MDIDHLIRDGDRVKATLQKNKNGLATQTGCKVHVPKRYINGKLGTIVDLVRVVGFFAIVIDDKYYAVNKTCAMMSLSPDAINEITIDDAEYLELTFEPGSMVVLGNQLVRSSSLLFNIYDELVAKGKTPWYLDYTDLGSIFDTAKSHAGVNLKAARSILEMMSASRARDPNDRSKYYRNLLKTQADLTALSPDIIPLRSVAYGATNTTAKLLGPYLNTGINSSLVNPSDRLERVEEILLL